jgi:hypothetical protein
VVKLSLAWNGEPKLKPRGNPRVFHSEGAGEVRQENFTFGISSKLDDYLYKEYSFTTSYPVKVPEGLCASGTESSRRYMLMQA